jgi:hypothetical protein
MRTSSSTTAYTNVSQDSRPWYQIFLDLTKAFDSIDRERLLKSLLSIASVLESFYGESTFTFLANLGTTADTSKENAALPKAMVDAIIRHWYCWGFKGGHYPRR